MKYVCLFCTVIFKGSLPKLSQLICAFVKHLTVSFYCFIKARFGLISAYVVCACVVSWQNLGGAFFYKKTVAVMEGTAYLWEQATLHTGCEVLSRWFSMSGSWLICFLH